MPDLINLQKQLDFIKHDVNKDMNRLGLVLRNVNIEVKFLQEDLK